jgi:hypothetical protein
MARLQAIPAGSTAFPPKSAGQNHLPEDVRSSQPAPIQKGRLINPATITPLKKRIPPSCPASLPTADSETGVSHSIGWVRLNSFSMFPPGAGKMTSLFADRQLRLEA